MRFPDMDKPTGPESCPVEVINLILELVGRKDLRSYASSSRAFRRHAAHLLLQRVTITRPSNIHSLSAFIHSDLHSSGASCIRYLSFRAVSFTTGFTKGQDYGSFIEPFLEILAGAVNIRTLSLVEADSLFSLCAPLLKAFAVLPNVKDLRVEFYLTELYNIQRLMKIFASSPGRVSLSVSTQQCHRTPFYLLDTLSMNTITELRVLNMSLNNTVRHPDDDIKALPSIETLVSSVTHYSYIQSNSDHTLRAALRTANIRDILIRLPNIRRLYLFGYDEFRYLPKLISDEDPDTWPTLDVLGADWHALGVAQPPIKFNALDLVHFKFNDHQTSSSYVNEYLPAILDRYKPSRLRLKFSVKGYAERHTLLRDLLPQHTPISHLWLAIDPRGMYYDVYELDQKRMAERDYNFLHEAVHILYQIQYTCTHLVLHFELQHPMEMGINDIGPGDLRHLADDIATTALPELQFISIRVGKLSHGAWKVVRMDGQSNLEEFKDAEEFERRFLDECGFLDV
ncbi:hypothetical protein PENSPDRAFT_752292 [Peniophora sp. CONT]|nr:hypothetical protein PENSPDRAFT_752292 [Peniophora sp. CONT]